jgi:hypothetical protein
MVFLLIKFFAEIAYQWITVTHLIFATRSFSSFVVPNLGMGVNQKTAWYRGKVRIFGLLVGNENRVFASGVRYAEKNFMLCCLRIFAAVALGRDGG